MSNEAPRFTQEEMAEMRELFFLNPENPEDAELWMETQPHTDEGHTTTDYDNDRYEFGASA